MMGAIVVPRSVDSSDRSNLMRAFIIGNGINCGRLSYDLMDALSSDRLYVPPTALKKTDSGPRLVITTNYCYLYGSNRLALFI